MRNKIIISLIVLAALVIGMGTMHVYDHRVAARETARTAEVQRQQAAAHDQEIREQKAQAAKDAAVDSARTKAGVPAGAALTDQCVVTNPTTKKTSVITGDCSEFKY